MNDFPVIKKGIYRHNKSGNRYEVLGVALETESGEALVIYRPLENKDYELFARNYAMFNEMVEINGQLMPRFDLIDTPRTFIV